jgi:hypothetical protein
MDAAVGRTLASCSTLAYNLGNVMRTLAMRKAVVVVANQPGRGAGRDRSQGGEPWPGVTFQMAEIAVSRQMLAEIPSLIARLQAPPARL